MNMNKKIKVIERKLINFFKHEDRDSKDKPDKTKSRESEDNKGQQV